LYCSNERQASVDVFDARSTTPFILELTNDPTPSAEYFPFQAEESLRYSVQMVARGVDVAVGAW
jgi:hypothetical protein